jgi:hypothetical protein
VYGTKRGKDARVRRGGENVRGPRRESLPFATSTIRDGRADWRRQQNRGTRVQCIVPCDAVCRVVVGGEGKVRSRLRRGIVHGQALSRFAAMSGRYQSRSGIPHTVRILQHRSILLVWTERILMNYRWKLGMGKGPRVLDRRSRGDEGRREEMNG